MAPGLDMHENGDDWVQLRLLAVETRGAACLGESLNLGKRVTDQILNFDTMVIGENHVPPLKGAARQVGDMRVQPRHQEHHPRALGVHVTAHLIL